MKRILVPTDFSKQAENALKVAVQLVKKYDCELYLMHLLDLPGTSSEITSQNSQLGDHPPEALFFMKMAKKRFQEILDRPYLKDIDVKEMVEFRSAFDGIIDGVKEHNIDLIVMGSSGASGMQEFFIGSNTEKVVRNSKVPVLVIKEEVPHFEVKDFVFATNISPKGKDSFWEALKFAKELDAKVHLTYINTASNFKTTPEIQEELAEFTKDAPYDNFDTVIYNDESVEKGIVNLARQIDAELMGIATHGRKGLAHFLNGSISESLVNHAKNPVITFHL